ncbi:hypothetical protein E2C01_004806 [Portunus trituberculatus]|uniref:Uncharacterized protein n=1 Tax=Portunus trituberculatus TaxID=210409 RepID=A0A5B7CQM8_PORTR|nr:hypothetical protein [Portunus trituberculatus]
MCEYGETWAGWSVAGQTGSVKVRYGEVQREGETDGDGQVKRRQIRDGGQEKDSAGRKSVWHAGLGCNRRRTTWIINSSLHLGKEHPHSQRITELILPLGSRREPHAPGARRCEREAGDDTTVGGVHGAEVTRQSAPEHLQHRQAQLHRHLTARTTRACNSARDALHNGNATLLYMAKHEHECDAPPLCEPASSALR